MNLLTFSLDEGVGFAGVTILLVAFLLNLTGRLSKDGYTYILLNIIGAGLACLASLLISYMPFVILEGTWTIVSIAALIRKFPFPGVK